MLKSILSILWHFRSNLSVLSHAWEYKDGHKFKYAGYIATHHLTVIEKRLNLSYILSLCSQCFSISLKLKKRGITHFGWTMIKWVNHWWSIKIIGPEVRLHELFYFGTHHCELFLLSVHHLILFTLLSMLPLCNGDAW